METLFNFLLRNTKPVEWRGFKSNKTIFGTDVDVNRTDVLVGFVIKDDPLPHISAMEKGKVMMESADIFVPEYDKEPMPSATLSLAIIIPEEFDKYELDMFRKGHPPTFKLKE